MRTHTDKTTLSTSPTAMTRTMAIRKTQPKVCFSGTPTRSFSPSLTEIPQDPAREGHSRARTRGNPERGNPQRVADIYAPVGLANRRHEIPGSEEQHSLWRGF